MAKATAPTQAAPKQPSNAIPSPTDPRAELFWLLGSLRGMNIESANRIAELVILLTSPAAEASATEVE